MMGVDVLDVPAEPPVLSPAQLEKRLEAAAPRGKKKDASAPLEKFVIRVSSGTALVPVSDARAPVKQITAADFDVAPATAQKGALDFG
jgi:hypothetical protein